MNLTRWVLFALCATRLWLMPLGSSFWIDEIGTVFVVRMGAHHPSLAVAPQVPASLYFWLPRAVQWLLGHLPPWASSPGLLEGFYRLPSVICIACTILVIARVAARLIGPESAWFAAFACMALRGFDYQASDARPYALGTLAASTAVYCLIRWLDSAHWSDAVSFAAAAAILWRVHLIYWPFYAVFLLYAAVRLSRRETPVTWFRAAAIFGAVGITLVPVAFDALTLFRQAGTHVIVALPGASEFWRSLKFGLIALCGCGAWLLSRRDRGATGSDPTARLGGAVPGASWTLILSWWLIQPLGLFAFSWLTGSSVFVDRYLSLALPGAALTATACAASFLSSKQARIATLTLATGVLLLLGQWRQVWPPHHNSDWRGAAQAIDALHFEPDSPIVTPSPFIEARAPAWSPSYALPGFLYAHLLVYPVTGRAILLPFSGSDEQYSAELAGRKHFVLYGQYPAIRNAGAWFVAQPRLAGWRNRSLGDFGDVSAILFEAP